MRRLINLVLIGLAFYGGLKFERMRGESFCGSGGGTWNGHYCVGAK